MTNKEKAQELWAVLGDETRSLEERRAAREELLLLKKAAKTSVLKLLGDAVGDQHDVDALMEADLELPEGAVLGKPSDELPPHDPAHATTEFDPLDEAPAPPKKPAQGERGLISAEVRRLLRGTELPYSDIEAAVRAAFPEARTTARSIASVAADLRRAGEAVPHRRGARP